MAPGIFDRLLSATHSPARSESDQENQNRLSTKDERRPRKEPNMDRIAENYNYRSLLNFFGHLTGAVANRESEEQINWFVILY